MSTRLRTLRAALPAALAVVALLSGTASAGEGGVYTMSPAGSFRSTSLGSLTFEASGLRIECPLTFEGSLDTEFASGEPEFAMAIGSISRGAIGTCTNSSTVTLLSLPWTLEHVASLGTYPNSLTGASFRMEGMASQLSTFGGLIRCLYAGSVDMLAPTTGTNPYTIGLLTVSSSRLQLRSGSCGETATVAGSFALSPAQRAAAVALKVEFTPKRWNFGNVAGTKLFTVRALQAVNVLAFGLKGSPIEYWMPVELDNCSGRNLAAGAECTFGVRYNGGGNRRTALLVREGGQLIGGAAIVPR